LPIRPATGPTQWVAYRNSSKVVTYGIELLAGALANGSAAGLRMLLPERDKLGAKTETHHGHIDFAVSIHLLRE
jgi:hypothetical protein